MRALLLSTKSEFRKLTFRKKYLVITILGALVCILRLGGSMLITKLSGGEIVIRTNLMTEMLGFIMDILVPMVLFMAVCDLFSSEIQEDNMKAALMRPLTRFKVMLSKSLAAVLIGCAVTVAMFFICLLIQIVSGGGIKNAPLTFVAYVIDMVPFFALVAMATFINMLTKSPTLSMLLCIAIYIFFKYLNIYVSPYGQMVFTAYSQWHKIWIGSSLPFGALCNKVGILFGSVLILYTASYIIFDRKDF